MRKQMMSDIAFAAGLVLVLALTVFGLLHAIGMHRESVITVVLALPVCLWGASFAYWKITVAVSTTNFGELTNTAFANAHKLAKHSGSVCLKLLHYAATIS